MIARVSQAKGAGGRALVQGLKGDATYLIVTDDNKMETFGVNAVCTHLGCVVPWNKAANKFMCPCHGAILNSLPQSSSCSFARAPHSILLNLPPSRSDHDNTPVTR